MRLPVVGRGRHKRSQNTAENVHGEMLLQICADYPGLPDPRTLTMGEIRFFYNGLRDRLKEHNKRAAAIKAQRP